MSYTGDNSPRKRRGERRVYGSAPARLSSGRNQPRSAVTLPQLLDQVVADLESQSDVERGLTDFFDMVGTLFRLDAVALFLVPESVSESPVLIKALDTESHEPVNAELPPQLLARIRLQRKGAMELSPHSGPCSPNEVFPIGRAISWGLAVAIH
ncbi:MAG: hypothetical protein QF464_20925, partial [Myxococcota bacterium]|nr:hypothetical protein [Myxococcota bacterium]